MASLLGNGRLETEWFDAVMDDDVEKVRTRRVGVGATRGAQHAPAAHTLATAACAPCCLAFYLCAVSPLSRASS